MDKRVALTILITHSVTLSQWWKKRLIEKVPDMPDDQVDRIGRMLADEREIILQNEDAIIHAAQEIIDYLAASIHDSPAA